MVPEKQQTAEENWDAIFFRLGIILISISQTVEQVTDSKNTKVQISYSFHCSFGIHIVLKCFNKKFLVIILQVQEFENLPSLISGGGLPPPPFSFWTNVMSFSEKLRFCIFNGRKVKFLLKSHRNPYRRNMSEFNTETCTWKNPWIILAHY